MDHELQLLFACLNDWRTSTCITVASTALFFYDFSLTFMDELHFMWTTNLSLGSVLFLLARYPAFVGAIIVLLPTSVTLDNINTCLRLVTIVSSELILAVRAWAIWGRSRRVMAFLVCVSIACLVPAIIIVERDIVSSSWSPTVAPDYADVSQCQIVISSMKHLWVIPYLMTIIYEVVTLSLTFVKISRWRKSIPVSMGSPALLDTLWRDGLMYYVFLSGLGVVNIALVLQVSSPQLRTGGTQLQTCFHSMLSTRAVLRLAASTSTDIYSTSVMMPRDPGMDSTPAMQFAEREMAFNIDHRSVGANTTVEDT